MTRGSLPKGYRPGDKWKEWEEIRENKHEVITGVGISVFFVSLYVIFIQEGPYSIFVEHSIFQNLLLIGVIATITVTPAVMITKLIFYVYRRMKKS